MSWKGVRVVDDAGHNVRLFTFAELTTVEDLNTGSQTVKQLKHLGEIEVRWIRARHLSVEPATKQNSTSNYKSVVDSGEIAEKKLKGRAISHQATLSKAEKIAPYNIIRLDYPRGRTPFATYIFKYRSRKALQAQFIIPRTPSPAPLEARAIESLTEDELRERLRRAEQANAQQVKIKQEMKRERATQIHSSDKDDDGEEAVQIHSVHVRKRLKTMFDAGLGVEVIDLSED
ncbi:hypothetical protein H2203_006113 [Taxawa tesnikishii (nom. ined.)]|nr:hypothetical protein H2203_006113 [Dothideales sp. JES 119]